MDIIKTEGLTKRYGSFTAVDGISFTVEKGTLTGFLGVNGAGKSTTISMLSTLIAPDGGEAEICGLKLGRSNAEIRRKIGIVYQQNCLDDIMSVKENLICRGILHGADRTQAKKQLNDLCDILTLGDILGKKYGTLSGGQKRRCEIAAALMHTPEILFLDEPTTGLDPATRKDVRAAIEQLRSAAGMTVFLTTHYMEEAAEAAKIIIISKGNVIADGTPFELKEHYARDYVRLYCSPEKRGDICNILADISPQPEDYGVSFAVNATVEALPYLDRVKGHISGFEVIQGNMDDVFLNAVGAEAQKE
ncbi:MAG: ATP-binding cassette domain-containing protein [Oscillospiraceae bacterium]